MFKYVVIGFVYTIGDKIPRVRDVTIAKDYQEAEDIKQLMDESNDYRFVNIEEIDYTLRGE